MNEIAQVRSDFALRGNHRLLGRKFQNMAKFMSSRPGATTGPAGHVHSVTLGEYIITGPLNQPNLVKFLMYLHDDWCVVTARREDVLREVRRRLYFRGEDKQERVPRRVFKKMMARHADALCAKGQIGLGPVRYYTAVENRRIVDPHEGFFIAHAAGVEQAVTAVLSAGQHVLVYCTTLDESAPFPGYDACVEISDPAAFARAVSRSVAAHFGRSNHLALMEHGPCVYQHSRILSGRLHGFTEALVRMGELSVDTIDVLTHKQYLIKERAYAKDAEYRFAFVMRRDVPDYTVVECAEAASFCRRIA